MYEVVHDLTGRSVFRIQIEVLCLFIVRHMMVDVEHTYGIDCVEYHTRALQLHITDDEEISGVAYALRRALDLCNPRQNLKGAGNLIINQDARVFAPFSQIVHHPEG